MDWDINTPEGMAAAIAWTQNHIALIRDGGTWLVPRSGTILIIKHSEKRVVVHFQLRPDPSIEKVFRAMGWHWVEL